MGFKSTELLLMWLEYYPCLSSMGLLLKYFLSMRKLNNLYKGGISSYCLILMIICFLKYFNLGHSDDLGENLIEFLKFFG